MFFSTSEARDRDAIMRRGEGSDEGETNRTCHVQPRLPVCAILRLRKKICPSTEDHFYLLYGQESHLIPRDFQIR